ncbi:MAG: hypothetical protein ABI651_08270 [Verrucomicrobiota bacterium]
MADDVTLEDLQKVNARIQKLETDLKEANRLRGILDTYVDEQFKNVLPDIITIKNTLKNLEKKVSDLDKKGGKK